MLVTAWKLLLVREKFASSYPWLHYGLDSWQEVHPTLRSMKAQMKRNKKT